MFRFKLPCRELTLTTTLACVAVTSLQAQLGILRGRVLNSATKAPLQGAEILVLGTTLQALTTPTGVFEFPAVSDGTYRIQVRRIGFLPSYLGAVQIASGDTVTVTLRLEPDPSFRIGHPFPPEALGARSCPPSWDAEPSLLRAAVRCAEDFVRRNGYTIEPPLPDTALLAPENATAWTGWHAELKRRRSRLDPHAVAASCDERRCRVYFEHADPSHRCRFQEVFLNAAGSGLRVLPGDASLSDQQLPLRCLHY